DLALGHANLAYLLRTTREAEARMALGKAIAHWEKLALDLPAIAAYRHRLARTFRELAALYSVRRGRPADAAAPLAAFRRALHLDRRVGRAPPPLCPHPMGARGGPQHNAGLVSP